MDARTDSHAPLPDMLGIAPPEHDVRGRILVLLIHGIGVTILGVALVVPAANEAEPGMRILSAAAGVLGVGSAVCLAEGLRKFRCWAWFFMMYWLAPPLLVSPLILLDGSLSRSEKATAAAAGMMVLGAVHYLWTRRREFLPDAKLESRRPRLRTVTPEWRAARLARIGAETGRVRGTVSPRAGALWMRRASAVRR